MHLSMAHLSGNTTLDGDLIEAAVTAAASPPTGVTPVASVIDTDPQDFVEGAGKGDTPRPVSLCEGQFTRG